MKHIDLNYQTNNLKTNKIETEMKKERAGKFFLNLNIITNISLLNKKASYENHHRHWDQNFNVIIQIFSHRIFSVRVCIKVCNGLKWKEIDFVIFISKFPSFWNSNSLLLKQTIAIVCYSRHSRKEEIDDQESSS